MGGNQKLKDRLDECAISGALSTADLACWFDLAYATMRSYRTGRLEPAAARRAQIEQRLLWLETAVRQDFNLPVPLLVRAGERQQYLRVIRARYELRGDLDGGVQ